MTRSGRPRRGRPAPRPPDGRRAGASPGAGPGGAAIGRGPARARASLKEETRAALVAAALAEFAAHGLDAPSLDAICARAGFTRGAFYVHFRDRDDLTVAVVEQAMAAFLDAVIASGDATHDLARTIDQFADAVVGSLAAATAAPHVPQPAGATRATDAPALPLPAAVPFARVLEAVTRSPRLRERFAGLLARAIGRLGDVAARGQRSGSVRDDVDPTQLGLLLAMVALGIMVALDARLPLDPAAARAAAQALIAPPSRRAPR